MTQDATRQDPPVDRTMPSPTTDIEQAKRDMDVHGCSILRGALDDETVVQLRDRVQEQAQLEREHGVAFFARPELGDHPTKGRLYHIEGARIGRPKEDPEWQSVRFLVNKGRMFIDLCAHPSLLEIARYTLRDEFYVGSSVGLAVRKGAHAQITHRDQHVMPVETPTPVALNVFIALTDFKESNGATLVAPGTHRDPGPKYVVDDERNLKGIEGFDPNCLQPAEIKAGDVFFYGSKLWHGQGASTSDDTRWNISIIYSVYWWRSQDTYTAALHDSVYETLTPEELDLLGFKEVGHAAGAIGPTSPDSTRYNSNKRLPYVPELHRNGKGRPVPADAEIEEW